MLQFVPVGTETLFVSRCRRPVNNNLEYNPNSCLLTQMISVLRMLSVAVTLVLLRLSSGISHFFIFVSVNLHEVVFSICAINMK